MVGGSILGVQITVTNFPPLAVGAGVHDGRLWHGSDRNCSPGPRRGLGIHFAPAEATFKSADGNTLAHKISREASTCDNETNILELNQNLFPITFAPPGLYECDK